MTMFRKRRRRAPRTTRGLKGWLALGIIALPIFYSQVEPHLGGTAKAYAQHAISFIEDLSRPTGPTVAGTASVIDGDTLELHGKRIRLHGLDAPESRQACLLPDGREWRCGRDAAFALADRIGRAPIECVQQDMDRYGRIVAVCYHGRENLNAWMVAQGWAVAYRQYSTDYVGVEVQAKAAKRGIWASSFDMPWDWRRR